MIAYAESDASKIYIYFVYVVYTEEVRWRREPTN